MIGAGFCGYMLLERALRAATERQTGHLRPASLTLHSLVDGLGIGLAFQVAPAIGVVVAVAVLAHDFADGINTVTLSLSGGGARGAPRCGWPPTPPRRWSASASTRLFSVAPGRPGPAVALFAGFFLYIGASELAPASHRALPRVWTSLGTLAGHGGDLHRVRLASG